MTKSELSEALALLYQPDPDDWGRNTTPVRYPLDVIGAAARRFADLLPEECEACGGKGERRVHCLVELCAGCDDPECLALDDHPCFACDYGKVWNPEVMERVAQAALDGVVVQPVLWDENVARIDWRQVARAVLAALAEEEVCAICLGGEWTCEHHVDRPWSGTIGNERGCEPDCAGPGVPCRLCWVGKQRKP